jgi:hypothetical protein
MSTNHQSLSVSQSLSGVSERMCDDDIPALVASPHPSNIVFQGTIHSHSLTSVSQ